MSLNRDTKNTTGPENRTLHAIFWSTLATFRCTLFLKVLILGNLHNAKFAKEVIETHIHPYVRARNIFVALLTHML